MVYQARMMERLTKMANPPSEARQRVCKGLLGGRVQGSRKTQQFSISGFTTCVP